MKRNQKIVFNNFEAVYISSPSNLFYFSNYANEDARILLTKDKQYYISDKRVREEFEQTHSDFTFIEINPSLNYTTKSIELLKQLKINKIAFEDFQILNIEFLYFKKFKMYPISSFLSKLRSIKQKDEIDNIILAQETTDMIFQKVLNTIKPGNTELEISSFINSEIYKSGCTLAFDTIVAFGKNTSKPHAHPGSSSLEENDIITIDFGAKYKGYCSDMTRSFAIGKIDEQYVDLYHAVQEAQNRALSGIHAGLKGSECDALAREYFKEINMDDCFSHSLGHSLGIDIHELPSLSKYYCDIIEEGVVTSVEPGLYIPGKFGVRIEDIVIVKQDGVHNLTKSPKNLIIL